MSYDIIWQHMTTYDTNDFFFNLVRKCIIFCLYHMTSYDNIWQHMTTNDKYKILRYLYFFFFVIAFANVFLYMYNVYQIPQCVSYVMNNNSLSVDSCLMVNYTLDMVTCVTL